MGEAVIQVIEVTSKAQQIVKNGLDVLDGQVAEVAHRRGPPELVCQKAVNEKGGTLESQEVFCHTGNLLEATTL